jgi:hypothetical protein
VLPHGRGHGRGVHIIHTAEAVRRRAALRVSQRRFPSVWSRLDLYVHEWDRGKGKGWGRKNTKFLNAEGVLRCCACLDLHQLEG